MESHRPGARNRVTLHDVAREAGVSPSTVSLVLAGKAEERRISEDTLHRVRQVALRMGYTPNLLHRSLREGRTRVVSFYNGYRHREYHDLYMDKMSASVEHAGGVFGYDVLVHCNFQRDVPQTFEFLNGGLADGVIFFAPTESDPLLPLLAASNLPVVAINPRAHASAISHVRHDDAGGTALLARALAENGHRRIAAVCERIFGQADPVGRLVSLRRDLVQYGLSIPDDQVVTYERLADGCLERVMALDPRPTAIFAWHDRAAYRLLEDCHRLGIRVPDDLSIVGYDGLIWPSKTDQVVTSIRVDLAQLGRSAMSLLNRLIEGEPGPLSEIVPVTLAEGTTLGPAPAV